MEKQEPNAFVGVSHTARGHFLLNFYAAVYYLVNHIRCLNKISGEDLDKTSEKYPFLSGYFEEMHPYLPDEITWEGALKWWETEITAWEHTVKEHLPLLAIEKQAHLNFHHRIAFIIIGLVEEDSRFGTLFSTFQEPLACRRPCVELVGQIVQAKDRADTTDPWSICQPLISGRLVDIANKDAPRSEWILQVPQTLWDVVRGGAGKGGNLAHLSHPVQWYRIHPEETLAQSKDLILPEEFMHKLEQIPSLVTNGTVNAVILRGSQGAERLTIMGALSRALHRGMLEVHNPSRLPEQQWDLLGPLCTMTLSMPVFIYDLGPGETAEVPSLVSYHGPVGIVTGFEGGMSGRAVEKAVVLTLPMPDIEQRLQYWERSFAGHPVKNITEISEKFHMPGGYIRQAAPMAIAHAVMNKRGEVTVDDIREACRILNRQMLDTLATRLEVEGSWDHLVVSETVWSKLRELESRCRHRESLLNHLGAGFGLSSNRGVRALLTGASGTGKTLAARVLAGELGMDLYRIDLAAVVNKYIGETEKNLHRVLSRAEELDVILLLDEGDALMGRRTEVKTSNDRYANLETNYLLQRLENYQGIVVITTNAGENIDNAFQRRMDVVVNFIAPQAQERWHIWQLHLPGNHDIDHTCLEEIAVRCVMTGGQIRNAAQHAALLALDGKSAVTQRHLEEAILSEYRKAGATCPLSENGKPERQKVDMDAFMNALTY